MRLLTYQVFSFFPVRWTLCKSFRTRVEVGDLCCDYCDTKWLFCDHCDTNRVCCDHCDSEWLQFAESPFRRSFLVVTWVADLGPGTLKNCSTVLLENLPWPLPSQFEVVRLIWSKVWAVWMGFSDDCAQNHASIFGEHRSKTAQDLNGFWAVYLKKNRSNTAQDLKLLSGLSRKTARKPFKSCAKSCAMFVRFFLI